MQDIQTSNTKFVYVYANGDKAPIDVTARNVDIPKGTPVRFSTDWAIAGVVQNGDTFEISVPALLEIIGQLPFPFKNAAGETMAMCAYTSTSPYVASCEFQGAPEGGYLDPNGNLFITVRGMDRGAQQDITFYIGGSTVAVTDNLSSTSSNHPHTLDGYFNLQRFRISRHCRAVTCCSSPTARKRWLMRRPQR